ncbi:hypothetical protein H4R19_005434 [Coemansia spiralis]|nr:hypothetical protein H4R19_005434 [Coemansia spiralis]
MTAEQQRQRLTPKELQHVATGVPSEPTASTSATVVAGPEQQRPLLVDIAVPEDEISEQRAQDAAEINNQAVEGEERRAGVVGRRASTVHQLVLAAQWLLYESFICYAPLVTIVYWVLLYPTQTAEMATAVDWWMGVSMHAFNMVLMVLEVFVLARCPCHWRHFGPIAGFMVLYLGLVYFMVAVYGFYVYPFFQPRYFGGYIAVMCLLIVNIAAIIWTIQLMVHRLRDTLYPRWLARHSNSTAAALPSPQPATLADSLASSAEKQRLPSDLS